MMHPASHCQEKKNPGKTLRAFRADGKNIAFRVKPHTTEREFHGK
jgi:hypothetical protein